MRLVARHGEGTAGLGTLHPSGSNKHKTKILNEFPTPPHNGYWYIGYRTVVLGLYFGFEPI